MAGPYRNSDFRINRYFQRFPEQIEQARRAGNRVLISQIRKLNNCHYDPAVEEAPTVCCPRCGCELLVPKDAFDQIRCEFIYKIER